MADRKLTKNPPAHGAEGEDAAGTEQLRTSRSEDGTPATPPVPPEGFATVDRAPPTDAAGPADADAGGRDGAPGGGTGTPVARSPLPPSSGQSGAKKG